MHSLGPASEFFLDPTRGHHSGSASFPFGQFVRGWCGGVWRTGSKGRAIRWHNYFTAQWKRLRLGNNRRSSKCCSQVCCASWQQQFPVSSYRVTESLKYSNLFFFLFLRYSHCAHVIGETLVVVGGVWHHSDGVPGGVVINLTTRSSMEFTMDTVILGSFPSVRSSTCSCTSRQETFCYLKSRAVEVKVLIRLFSLRGYSHWS